MADSEAAAAMARSFAQEYFQIPVVTRAYTTACVLTTAAVVRNNNNNNDNNNNYSVNMKITNCNLQLW